MLRFSKVFAVLVALLFSILSVSAQNLNVKGRVIDSTGNPMVSVLVYEDGNTSNGTVTDIDGNYSINVPRKGRLIFSSLGFAEVIENISDRSSINVTMQEDKLFLDAAEVVSVGYGTVARRDLTGSVSKVDMGGILKTSSTSFDSALSGRIAGVVVSTGDGAVGSEATITIRGNNSLTQSSAPLYIIDGFPMESSMASSINPADIESIDVLKDASATAIYGARGANGVIVITTKSGLEGKPKVSFDAKWSVNTISNKIDLMSAYDFVALQAELCDVKNITNTYFRNPDGDVRYTLKDYEGLEGVDMQDAIYRTALTQNYTVSVTGGSKEAGSNYNASVSALDQDGIIHNSNFQRYQGKFKFVQKLGKKVQLDLLANYSRSITNGITPTDAQQSSSASGWLIYSVWGYRPIKPIYMQDEGQFDELIDASIASADDYRFNPAKTVRNEYRKSTVDYINANAGLTWEILEGLKLKVTGAYSMTKRKREAFDNSQTYNGYEGSPSAKGINAGVYWYDTRTWLNENTLTWVKRYNRAHNINALAGFTMQGQDYNYNGTSSIRMTTEALGLNGMHTGSYQTVTPVSEAWTMMSALFRLNYNYKYRYYLTASFRADGSSKFPVKNRWGYFPSVGLSWNFNRESWLKDKSWLTNGKLRASWGLTGNNRTSTPYDFYSQISTLPGSVNSLDYVFNGSTVSGYYPNNMANEDLRWETTEQYNVGIDLAFFEGNRIKITADWYLKNTRDLLLQATLPTSSGYKNAMVNIGSMRNSGYEFTLDVVPVKTRNFEWDLNFNIAFNRNVVTALTTNQYSLFSNVSWDTRFNSQNPYVTQIGKPSGMMYGYIYEGTYKKDDFVSGTILKDGIPYLSNVERDKIRPGDPKYRDVNEDGIIDDNDRTVIGCGQPIHTGGFGTSFYFYGFDVNFFFNWSYGNDVINANRLVFENGTRSNLNLLSSYKNYYCDERPDSDIPRLDAIGMDLYSSRVVEDASYLRLRNITLGYTLPKRFLSRMRLSQFRIYVNADNVVTFTKYSGPDPEVSTRKSVLTPGFDWSAYPRAKGVTAGIQLTF